MAGTMRISNVVRILFSGLLAIGFVSATVVGDNRPKPPYRVLYSNDTTHILTNISPYHGRREPFRPEMLEASVDETADTGVDVHILQPGMGWVPWWHSKAYPYGEHVRWMKERFGVDPPRGGFEAYMAEGGDLVKVFVDRCRLRGLAPFISIRLNDGHRLEEAVSPPGSKNIKYSWHSLSRFYVEHPEYRLGNNPNVWEERVLNWVYPEVRNYRLQFIREICAGYDIDGLELDFMRYYSYFRLAETTRAQRVGIMTEFVRMVRQVLDQTAKPDQRRWLCVRVPAILAMHDALGIDLPAMVRNGVDMVNVSASYFTEQQNDFARIRQLIPEAAVYLEMAHSAYNYRSDLNLPGAYDNFQYRRVTDEQFYTTAHLAYSRGYDGVSLFNFVYYREHTAPELGPFHEPPFPVIKHLSDPVWLAGRPQHYFLASGFVPRGYMKRQLPIKYSQGQSQGFSMDLAPPHRGWRGKGRMRIQCDRRLGERQFSASLNGKRLKPVSDCSEPYQNPYRPFLGGPEYHRAWIVPAQLLRPGFNQIDLKLEKGETIQVLYLDLAVK